jgi:glucuronate isomerase
MKPFIHANFLLGNKTAEELYHKYSENLPIIDFHCHLSPEMIANDRQFGNLTQAWLEGDHYKWRAMRTNGINEKYCTGEAPEFAKFQKWRRQFLRQQEIPFITGRILSLQGTLI